MRRQLATAAILLGGLGCSRSEPTPRTAPHHTVVAPQPGSRHVVLAEAGRPRTVVYAPARLFEDETPLLGPRGKPIRRKAPRTPEEKLKAQQTKRLKASARDLTDYLSRMIGAPVELVQNADGNPPKPDAGVVPIYLSELAQARFGAPQVHAPGAQGFRVVVTKSGIGLDGESDLATSYAIYELLDRLGCRWFMPGELGEEIPHPRVLTLAESDDSSAPSTLYRGLWYADDDYKRRNRLGGLELAAGPVLERWISDEQRQEHPDWRAQIKGAPDPKRLRWSNPEVAHAIAAAIEAKVAERGLVSVSLSPADGINFDEGDDRAVDAKDWDSTTNSVSLSDRLLVLANRVAAEVVPQHPDLMFGLLAYVSYSRPPVRETVHPNVVPVIAPITYCREHPWSDDRCPGATALRDIIQGWSTRAEKLAFRGYAFNLAEPSAPNPMVRKWSSDLPFLFAHKVRFFQPETMPTFESTLPALYLGVRLSWNARLDPSVVVNELYERFYGHAATATRAYLERIDRAWIETPEYSGGGLGYARIFTPQVLSEARQALNDARAACQTDTERARVGMLDESLTQLELYMKMNSAFSNGHFAQLPQDLSRWLTNAGNLAEKYAPNSAFGKARWAGEKGIYGNYAKRFLEPVYTEAGRIAREGIPLTAQPLCSLNYWLEPDAQLPEASPRPTPDRKLMNVCTDTWSSIGQHDYFGAMGYEASVDVASLPPSKRAFLWLSKIDGTAQVWVNDTLVQAEAPAPSPTAEAHLRFVSYDVSQMLHPGAANKLSIVIKRTRLAELGAGGLLGPVYLYRER
jgi:hypothetical protein